MIHVILCDQYIAAVTDSNAQLSDWIRMTPLPEHLRIESRNYTYPFVALESNEDNWRGLMLCGKFSLFPGDYPETNAKGFQCFKDASPHHTIYTFTQNWQGTAMWGDMMGMLSHEHFGEEDEI